MDQGRALRVAVSPAGAPQGHRVPAVFRRGHRAKQGPRRTRRVWCQGPLGTLRRVFGIVLSSMLVFSQVLFRCFTDRSSVFGQVP